MMCGYICTFRKERVEVYTEDGQYAAQTLAAVKLGVTSRNQHKISVWLAEKDGKPHVHSTGAV